MEVSLLSGLNEAQRAAVTSAAAVLLVLAPPGSGKTKTLTSRVAYLLTSRQYDPHNVICCTFTIKASREMRERLCGMIGEQLVSKLVLGTFHSICRRYLVAYGSKIGIGKGFSIADTSDSKSIVKRIIKRLQLKIEDKTARSKISWNKARFRTVEVLERELANAKEPSAAQQDLITVYREYEGELRNSNLMDYDDLLLRCVDLLRAHPECVANVEALLIDEFQDTNIVQFELMKLLASGRNQITTVGDPDQGIYSFRAAEIENLKRMIANYKGSVVINLEENYRSAGAILRLAQDVIEQDTERPNKKLKSIHCFGTLPVLRRLPNPHEEGIWIATEIKRTMALSGGLIEHSDIAVLIRSGFLSLLIEKAFTSAGIPYRMVGGMRFFDRAEIRLIIDYLRTISHPNNNAAFLAIINVPSRKIGESAIASLTKLAEEKQLSIFQVVQKVLAGRLAPEKKLSKPSEQDLAKLVTLINRARDRMEDMQPAQVPSQLISYVVDSLRLQAYLQSKYKDDYEDRIENIQELITHASDVAAPPQEETLPVVHGVVQEQIDKSQEALDQFLANIVLSSEVEQDDKADTKPRVTISTIHSAKGLEWPVVFVPAVYEGSIPHSRAEDTDEERRLLYVAITRAQALLNITFPVMGSRDQGAHDMTPFLPTELHHRTANKAPALNDKIVADMATILRRDMPSQEALAAGISSLSTKQSAEDDLWPLDGRPALGPEQNIMTGDTAFPGLGMSLHEADNRAYNGQGFQSVSAVFGQQTTMSSTAGFSSANTSMSGGFTTANKQMQSMSSTHEVTDTMCGTTLTGQSQTLGKSSKGSITSFFSRKTPAADAARQSWSARTQSASTNSVKPMPEPHHPTIKRQVEPQLPSQIPVSLATHRLSSTNGMGRAAAPGRVLPSSAPSQPHSATAGFKRPRPMPLEETSSNRDRKKYVFLSSSPTRDVFDENGELAMGVKDDLGDSDSEVMPRKAAVEAGSQVVGGSLSTGGASVYPSKKRSLGVRGAFVPWGERKHK